MLTILNRMIGKMSETDKMMFWSGVFAGVAVGLLIGGVNCH